MVLRMAATEVSLAPPSPPPEYAWREVLVLFVLSCPPRSGPQSSCLPTTECWVPAHHQAEQTSQVRG
ncbi:hypothetical protein B0T26DRAFT_722428 [Lasiosphaeria miniovina]|uniref:Uncharacterized protein n=1 Tax=Lasiosphaeria miniovina TaxID=1954250 RepID=A0AA40A5F5_9PEZI|nr:uncharacterized protein B0T26DRAFT_722428 [Lasiosphaeria miniovina]KAK0709659.1 hypothetical protein B0T26DRAFT_722428 [Lasiosphaeria miniovina]